MSYKFFENTDCEYYPCHNLKRINCMFCYCPLYNCGDCGGAPTYIKTENGEIKDCSNCSFPHVEENYDKVISKLNCTRR